MRADDAIIRLETRRLEMRRSEPDDAEAISAYRSDPAVRRYQGWERTDPDGIRTQIDEMSGRAPGEPGWVQLSVRERESGRLVGDVGLSATSDEPGVIEIGYTIDPAFQGRGYATEAVGALVAYALEELGADVIRAYASAKNLPSIRVAEKAGLKLVERFQRQHDGKLWWGVRYELRREDAAHA
jgi:RimJ/RimL family protein N-acetyltransferase